MPPLKKVKSDEEEAIYQAFPEDYQKKKRIAYIIIFLVVVICVGLIISLTLWFTLREPYSLQEPSTTPSATPTISTSFGKNNATDAVLDFTVGASSPLTLTLRAATGGGDDAVIHLGTTSLAKISGYAACTDGTIPEPCLQINTTQYEYTVALIHETNLEEPDFTCTSVSWTASLAAEVTDCIELGSSHWFGGGTLFEQKWPTDMEKNMTPFVSGDIFQDRNSYGAVLEPYWVSTNGFAVSVEWNAQLQPLHTSWNSSGDGRLCIMARYSDSPYVYADQTALKLKYSVCSGKSIEHAHKAVLKYRNPWSRPSAIPDTVLFEKPIWSTWVQYKSRLTEADCLEFIRNIADKKFPASNIEIDDGYQEKYGDYSFNRIKFPRPWEVIAIANSTGFRVTAWAYPFINFDADAFIEALDKGYLVGTVGHGTTPAMTSWWNGDLAGLVDFSNTNASSWYFSRLKSFGTFPNGTLSMHSYKFDAGESNWMPGTRRFFTQTVSPDGYGKSFAEAAVNEVGNGLEVRTGLHNQHLPVFVRMLDKDSVPGYDNGLKTLIPTALVFGLLGYPFVLPDMVGGNAYRNTSEGGTSPDLLGDSFPSDKLFLRWLGATIFMPSIQFSIPPWRYNGSSLNPVNTALTLLEQRANYTNLFIELAQNAVETGHPIIRPLWWSAGNDKASWTVDDQFLVGDTLMVAPVLDIWTDARSIYVPPGLWFDELRKENVVGPKTLLNYVVAIDRVPVFRRLS